jgi:glucose-6-phosphate isomerase/transaldolase/glucose-6-phosphate isomerase
MKPNAYGADRFFVYLKLKGEKNAALDQAVQALVKAKQPVLQFNLRDHYDLGAEFFRWEFATAVAGHVLGIHPFDQPNVQESKDNTSRVLDTFQSTGRLPTQSNHQPKEVANALSGLLQPGSYLSVLGYTTPTRPLEAAVGRLRRALMSKYRVATTFGYGPRYLHSTGQLHKGGPNTGVFLELVDHMAPDLPIPGRPFSFGTLANAQASGDLESLRTHPRQAIRVQLGRNPVAVVNAIAAVVTGTAAPSRRTGSKKLRRKARR